MTLPTGYMIKDTYRVEGILGNGGMSVVYEVTHVHLGRSFALKLIHAVHSHKDYYRVRFLQEARILGQLRHPHIVEVSDVGTTPEGTPFMVMEKLEGQTLTEFIAQMGPLPPEIALSICRQIGQALKAAHTHKQHPVVHRDLSPGNIFLCPVDDDPYYVKILDFGIAKWNHPEHGVKTHAPIQMGTPPYMSPEQVRGDLDLDARTDQFALGAILYEMLTGEKAFLRPGEEPKHALHHVQFDEPPALPLPPELEPALRQALSKNRADRFSSIVEFLAALGVAISSQKPVRLGVPSGSKPTDSGTHAAKPPADAPQKPPVSPASAETSTPPRRSDTVSTQAEPIVSLKQPAGDSVTPPPATKPAAEVAPPEPIAPRAEDAVAPTEDERDPPPPPKRLGFLLVAGGIVLVAGVAVWWSSSRVPLPPVDAGAKDMRIVEDLAPPRDLTSPRDLTPPRDLKPPPDLAPPRKITPPCVHQRMIDGPLDKAQKQRIAECVSWIETQMNGDYDFRLSYDLTSKKFLVDTVSAGSKEIYQPRFRTCVSDRLPTMSSPIVIRFHGRTCP